MVWVNHFLTKARVRWCPVQKSIAKDIHLHQQTQLESKADFFIKIYYKSRSIDWKVTIGYLLLLHKLVVTKEDLVDYIVNVDFLADDSGDFSELSNELFEVLPRLALVKMG